MSGLACLLLIARIECHMCGTHQSITGQIGQFVIQVVIYRTPDRLENERRHIARIAA